MSDSEKELDETMILEKYKEDIKFLHHQIKYQNLTPDEILAKEDIETNHAKQRLSILIEKKVREALGEAFIHAEALAEMQAPMTDMMRYLQKEKAKLRRMYDFN